MVPKQSLLMTRVFPAGSSCHGRQYQGIMAVLRGEIWLWPKVACVLVQAAPKPHPFPIDDLADCVEMGMEYTVIGVPCYQRKEINGHITVSTILEV